MFSQRVRKIQSLTLLVACAITISGLAAQSGNEFLFPPDKEFQDLLKALAAYQETASQDGGPADASYLVKAIERLEARLSSDSNPTEVQRLILPLLYFRIDKNARAVQLLENYLADYPESSRGNLLLAFGYLRQEQYVQAEELVKKVLAQDPRSAYARYLLGISHSGLNRREEAIADFEKTIELDPNFGAAYVELGIFRSKEPETAAVARDLLEKALFLGVERPEVHTNLGFVLIKLNKFAEAVIQLERALELAPDHTEAHYLLADAYRKQDLKDKAAAALERFNTLRAAARERTARESRGLTFFEDGMKLLSKDQFREAHASFRKVLEIFPNMAAAYYRMAQTEYLRGRTKESLESIRKAIELDPLEPEYYFVLARCLERTGDPEAVEAISEAISLNPEVADFHNLKGNLLFEKGDYGNAADAYRRATALEADNPAFHLNLSAALDKVGDRQESQKEKDLYLELLRAKNP